MCLQEFVRETFCEIWPHFYRPIRGDLATETTTTTTENGKVYKLKSRRDKRHENIMETRRRLRKASVSNLEDSLLSKEVKDPIVGAVFSRNCAHNPFDGRSIKVAESSNVVDVEMARVCTPQLSTTVVLHSNALTDTPAISFDHIPKSEEELDSIFLKPPVESQLQKKSHVGLLSVLRANLYLSSLLVFLPLGFGSYFLQWGDTLTFCFNFMAILPQAWLMGKATEDLATHAGQIVGGLLNAWFGNVVEMLLCIAGLRAGELVVVKATLVGSILSNLLLVSGCSFLFGGMKHKIQEFSAIGASTNASLMTLSCLCLGLPTMYATVNQSATDSELSISRSVSFFLIFVYVQYLVFQLVTHSFLFEEDEDDDEAELSVNWACGILGTCTVLCAFCSEFLIHSIEGTVATRNISKSFIGIILLPIVGNAAEHYTSVIVAMRNKMDLSLACAIGSSCQMALFVTPFTVLAGWALGQPMSLDLHAFEMVVLLLAVLIVTGILQDGYSNWLEGSMLLAAYVVIVFLQNESSPPISDREENEEQILQFITAQCLYRIGGLQTTKRRRLWWPALLGITPIDLFLDSRVIVTTPSTILQSDETSRKAGAIGNNRGRSYRVDFVSQVEGENNELEQEQLSLNDAVFVQESELISSTQWVMPNDYIGYISPLSTSIREWLRREYDISCRVIPLKMQEQSAKDVVRSNCYFPTPSKALRILSGVLHLVIGHHEAARGMEYTQGMHEIAAMVIQLMTFDIPVPVVERCGKSVAAILNEASSSIVMANYDESCKEDDCRVIGTADDKGPDMLNTCWDPHSTPDLASPSFGNSSVQSRECSQLQKDITSENAFAENEAKPSENKNHEESKDELPCDPFLNPESEKAAYETLQVIAIVERLCLSHFADFLAAPLDLSLVSYLQLVGLLVWLYDRPLFSLLTFPATWEKLKVQGLSQSILNSRVKKNRPLRLRCSQDFRMCGGPIPIAEHEELQHFSGHEFHFCISWLLTFFTHDLLPVTTGDSVLCERIWDALLAGPPGFLVYFCARLLSFMASNIPYDIFGKYGIYLLPRIAEHDAVKKMGRPIPPGLDCGKLSDSEIEELDIFHGLRFDEATFDPEAVDFLQIDLLSFFQQTMRSQEKGREPQLSPFDLSSAVEHSIREAAELIGVKKESQGYHGRHDEQRPNRVLQRLRKRAASFPDVFYGDDPDEDEEISFFPRATESSHYDMLNFGWYNYGCCILPSPQLLFTKSTSRFMRSDYPPHSYSRILCVSCLTASLPLHQENILPPFSHILLQPHHPRFPSKLRPGPQAPQFTTIEHTPEQQPSKLDAPAFPVYMPPIYSLPKQDFSLLRQQAKSRSERHALAQDRRKAVGKEEERLQISDMQQVVFRALLSSRLVERLLQEWQQITKKIIFAAHQLSIGVIHTRSQSFSSSTILKYLRRFRLLSPQHTITAAHATKLSRPVISTSSVSDPQPRRVLLFSAREPWMRAALGVFISWGVWWLANYIVRK